MNYVASTGRIFAWQRKLLHQLVSADKERVVANEGTLMGITMFHPALIPWLQHVARGATPDEMSASTNPEHGISDVPYGTVERAYTLWQDTVHAMEGHCVLVGRLADVTVRLRLQAEAEKQKSRDPQAIVACPKTEQTLAAALNVS